MTDRMEASIIKLCREQIAACQDYLAAVGVEIADPHDLRQAARRVVAARYDTQDDAWGRLKQAIGDLEDIVGRP